MLAGLLILQLASKLYKYLLLKLCYRFWRNWLGKLCFAKLNLCYPKSAGNLTSIFLVQLGTINSDNQVAGYDDLKHEFKKLKAAGVDGVMVDCWWGLVESKAPQDYVWSGYHSLFTLARECGLKLQVHVLTSAGV